MSQLLTPADAGYPPLLKEVKPIPDPLYFSGDITLTDRPTISIIGSRNMSLYGEKVLRMLVPPLVQAGLVIVSGLAYGVDSYAHKVMTEHGGKGIVVLGSGLDTVYPRANQGLFQTILKQGGCGVSEYPDGTQPHAYHFPERNRIVSGLSPVLLVIEAGENSGTLITANYALEQGREVCVVPGDITREQSKGIYRILERGAYPVTSAEEILSHYDSGLTRVIAEELRPALTGSPATLYDLILRGVETVDQLQRQSGLLISELQSVLSVLELDGYIYYKGDRWLKT